MSLASPYVRPRGGGQAPMVRPWAPVAVGRRVFHWIDTEREPDFECPSAAGDERVTRLQDVLVWDPHRLTWRVAGWRPCATCLPLGVVVRPEPRALALLVAM